MIDYEVSTEEIIKEIIEKYETIVDEELDESRMAIRKNIIAIIEKYKAEIEVDKLITARYKARAKARIEEACKELEVSEIAELEEDFEKIKDKQTKEEIIKDIRKTVKKLEKEYSNDYIYIKEQVIIQLYRDLTKKKIALDLGRTVKKLKDEGYSDDYIMEKAFEQLGEE